MGDALRDTVYAKLGNKVGVDDGPSHRTDEDKQPGLMRFVNL